MGIVAKALWLGPDRLPSGRQAICLRARPADQELFAAITSISELERAAFRVRPD